MKIIEVNIDTAKWKAEIYVARASMKQINIAMNIIAEIKGVDQKESVYVADQENLN